MDVTVPAGSYLGPSFEHATAADAMRPQVLTGTPDTPLITAAQRLASEHVHALVVLRHEADAAGSRPWAALTDRDVLRNAADAELMTAGEVASAVASPSDALADVAKAMTRLDTAHVLVVDPRDQPGRSASSRRSTSPASSGGAGPEGTHAKRMARLREFSPPRTVTAPVVDLSSIR